MPVVVLNTCIYANMQLTRNSFRQLFHDEIFSLTFPWLIVKSLTFPSQLSNSQTFPGFLDKWSLGKLKTKESKKLNRTRSSAVTDRLCDASLKLFCHTYLITLLMLSAHEKIPVLIYWPPLLLLTLLTTCLSSWFGIHGTALNWFRSHLSSRCFNPLAAKGNYSATSNNTKLVHWPLMGELLHLVQRGGAWAGCGPVQSPPHCTKCNSPPINGQCTNHCIDIWWFIALRF